MCSQRPSIKTIGPGLQIQQSTHINCAIYLPAIWAATLLDPFSWRRCAETWLAEESNISITLAASIASNCCFSTDAAAAAADAAESQAQTCLTHQHQQQKVSERERSVKSQARRKNFQMKPPTLNWCSHTSEHISVAPTHTAPETDTRLQLYFIGTWPTVNSGQPHQHRRHHRRHRAFVKY